MSSGNGSKKVKVPYKFNTVQLTSLKAHPKQAEVRVISDEALQGLGNFIDKVGLVEEIAINERTGHIISGHQRCKILIDKGYTSARVKVFDVDEDTEDLMFTNLNSQAISGAFTDEAKPWIQSLEARLGSELYQDIGLQMLEVSLAEPEEQIEEGLTDPDDVPATPKEAKTKTGDLYQLGNHRLLCGDAMKKEDVERLMGGEKADAIVTDPPYGMNLDTDFSGMKNNLQFAQAKGLKSGRKYEQVKGDDMDFDPSPIIELFCDPREQLWFGADYYADKLSGRNSGAWFVWDKRLDESADKMFGSCFELIWSKKKCKRQMLRHKWAGIFGTEQEPQRGRQHPTQKSVAVMVDLVGRTTGLIADPFLGSGTTMIACEQLDRKCYGIEICPEYVSVAIERWQQFTGKSAVLIETGQTYDEVKIGGVHAKQ